GEYVCETPSFPVHSFSETPGCGLRGIIEGHSILLGSRIWLEAAGINVGRFSVPPGSLSYLVIDDECRGAFVLANSLRTDVKSFLFDLEQHYELALLSGDNEKEHELFKEAFGKHQRLH